MRHAVEGSILKKKCKFIAEVIFIERQAAAFWSFVGAADCRLSRV